MLPTLRAWQERLVTDLQNPEGAIIGYSKLLAILSLMACCFAKILV